MWADAMDERMVVMRVVWMVEKLAQLSVATKDAVRAD